MRIVNLGFGKKRLIIEPDTDLYEAKLTYSEDKYNLEMEGKFSNTFLKDFAKQFNHIEHLSTSARGEICHDYLYNLKELKSLYFSSFQKELDLSKLPKLHKLGIDWAKKYILNLESQTSLQHIIISDFNEKDFKRIPNFEKLKSFRSIGGKLKSLDNIEAIKNIVALEISAHRSLQDLLEIKHLKNLKFIELNSCWKVADLSPLAELKQLEVVKIIDCKNLESIKFVKELPNLRQLYTLGTTIINDFDTTPAENVPIFFGSQYSKYNKEFPEKEIKEGQKTWSSYV